MDQTRLSIPRLAFRASALTVLAAAISSAQFKAGIEGTVTDSSGASVGGATVTVTSQETSRSQQVTTSDAGFYRVAGLAPGRYTVTASLSGFKEETVKDLQVNAEDLRGVNLALQPGEVKETITVSAEAVPELQTENGNVSGQITNEQVHALPQNGRDPYELLRLAPGVFGDGARSGNGNATNLPNTGGPGGSNTSIFQTENMVPISANGQRVADNNFQIDGVSVNSLGFGGAAVVTPNQESVKEIKVTSNAYDAQYGRNSGAQIEVVSQNGTNRYHGSAFFKYDEPGLNAFNKYGGPNGAADQRVENAFRNFGGSVGGPILKDKLFLFLSYEGLHNSSQALSGPTYVETPQYRDAVIAARPNGITARIFQTAGTEPRVVEALTPSCTGFAAGSCQVVTGGLDIGSITGAQGQYVDFIHDSVGGGLDGVPDAELVTLALPNEQVGNQYNARVDFQRGLDSFAFSTYLTKLNSVGADTTVDGRPIGDTHFKPLNSAFWVQWNRTLSSTLLNQARFNVTRFAENGVTDNAGANYGIPEIQVESYSFGQPRAGAARNETSPGIFAQNTIEGRDTVNKVLGKHGAKFGIEVRKEQDNGNLLGGARPLYSFSGFWNLANDTPIYEAINTDPRTGAPGNAQKHFRTSDWGLFAQDDWKLRRNLTLNYGLRWEYFSPLTEHRNQLSNIIFPTPGDLAHTKVQVLPLLYRKDWTNFAPRFGFAYSPPQFSDRLVVRGGFGVFFNKIPDAVFTNTRGNPPFFARNGLCCGTAGASVGFGAPFQNGIQYVLGSGNSPTSYPVNPNLAFGIDPANGGLCGDLGCTKDTEVEIYGAPPNMEVPYVFEYSFGFEYSGAANWVAAIGYEGSATHRVTRIVNQNFLYAAGPAFAPVYFPMDDVNANFNASNMRLTHRFSRGFQTEIRYRWSRSIDELSYGDSACACGNQTYPQVLKSERGPSDFDAAHYLTWSGLWDLPLWRGRNDFLGAALGGWQLSGIMTWHTGFPWTPVSGACISTPGGPGLCPTRPVKFFGNALVDTSNDAFTRPGGDFPGGGSLYFVSNQNFANPLPPGIGRNSFRGPHYWGTDLSLAKQFRLSSFKPTATYLGEAAKIDVRVNAFNLFNQLNLAPFQFNGNEEHIDNAQFGQASSGLAGRVIEFQARLSF